MTAPTLQQAMMDAATALHAAGTENAALDARALMAHVLGGIEEVIKNQQKQMDNGLLQQYCALVARRQQHEPIAQIIGKKEFWSLDFTVTRDTLTPRPETETLVEAALQYFPNHNAAYALLDLGTGTGCLLITLLRELPQSIGIGIDISTEALAIAQANAHALHVASRAQFRQGNWAEGITERFDIITSNPPYIPAGEIKTLAPDVVHFEPHGALVGGEDGLECYRALMPQVAELLKPGGIALFEIGRGQSAEVKKIAGMAGLKAVEVRPDLAGIERCVIIKRR